MHTRTLRSVLSAGLVAAALSLAAGGCKWTDFDDLKEETWATSTGKPDNSAANWAVAIARIGRGGPGAEGTLAVLGANEALYDELTIGPGGDVNTTAELPLDTMFSIGMLANEPLLLSRPDADEVALVTGVDASRSLVLRTVAGQLDQVSVNGPGLPTAVTYMVPPPGAGGGAQPVQMLLGQAENVFAVLLDQAVQPTMAPRCTLVDGATTMAKINVRALAAYRLGATAMSDDVLVLTDTGKLLAYSGSVFGNCTMALPSPAMSADLTVTNVQPGSQILVFSDAGTTYAVVQAHSDTGKGRLGLYRITAAAIEEVGTTRDVAGLRTAALFQHTDGAKRYVLAGVPTANVEGVVAGQVQAFELDTAAGFALAPAMSLSDAQPEDRQSFGRGVAALPFNGKTIIAVAADNDVFVYFRTTLYGETREGR